MRVLVVNAGSSSLKLSVLDDGEPVHTKTLERWAGEGDLEPIREFVELAGRVDAVGHRVVHGGPRLTRSVRVDDDVLDYLTTTVDLAPLHNPRSVAGIEAVKELLDVPAVACFDTAFHSGLPPAASTYALPGSWNRRWTLRRYGFHGLSHQYAVRRAAEIVDRPLEDLRIISGHLGAGASLTAVRAGRPVDTTMGFTPLEGLVMATRSGSLDPGLVLWLIEHGGFDAPALYRALENDSGLKGLSGTSGDIREVLAKRAAGDDNAGLAFDVYLHRLVREAGAMAASAGGLDVLAITGGVGEHSPDVREQLGSGLAHLGVRIDRDLNQTTRSDADISTADSGVRVVVVTAREDAVIARETEQLLAER